VSGPNLLDHVDDARRPQLVQHRQHGLGDGKPAEEVGVEDAAHVDAFGLERGHHRFAQRCVPCAQRHAGACPADLAGDLEAHAAPRPKCKLAAVEPGAGQLQRQGILPIDPAAHGVGGLTAAELLQELEHRDQCKAPRRKARLARVG